MAIFGYVRASYKVFKDKKLTYMYHKEEDIPDSGWRFFAGDETPEVLDLPDAIEEVSLSNITSLFPEVEKIVNSTKGNATFRRLEDGSWKQYTYEPMPW